MLGLVSLGARFKKKTYIIAGNFFSLSNIQIQYIQCFSKLFIPLNFSTFCQFITKGM